MNNSHQPDTYVLTGAFSTGKTTQFDMFKERYGHDPRFHFIEDGGRKMLRELGKRPEDLSEQEKADGQLYVMEHYMREEARARSMGKVPVMDSSIIEGIAYAKYVIRGDLYRNLNNILASKASRMTAIYFPVQLDVEDDGVRHTDVDFQHEIDQRILGLIREHNIKVITLLGDTPEVRQSMVEMTILQGLDKKAA